MSVSGGTRLSGLLSSTTRLSQALSAVLVTGYLAQLIPGVKAHLALVAGRCVSTLSHIRPWRGATASGKYLICQDACCASASRARCGALEDLCVTVQDLNACCCRRCCRTIPCAWNVFTASLLEEHLYTVTPRPAPGLH